ncbi:energy-coupled thiamine transporter ThiT [Parasporobacterium paucivorans]|uniref:Thiamine transporter n=1 Tax=Parasporobacterium paucivorans DSM 15970 TaxID=1122934 RepID=A0A1M6KJC6_9FIRM|nr:energy-coupled thiamine transporter ThiT [Parasporobacterium paucivorans]SHJ59009.1 thiamine transporter [Parasporobacterium paucivorans DSM 15970]
MSDFFAFPTVNSWEENVFKLTTPGIITVVILIVALIAVALFIRSRTVKSPKSTTRQLVFSAIALALAMVTSMIKPFEMPMGGSVTFFSMLFICLIGYWYGPKAGIMTAVAYGLLQFLISPIFYSIPQMIVDYPLAFGALGLSGFFAGRKYGLVTGYIVGVFGRLVFAFLSGLLFFAAYAEGSGMSAPVYSLAYNAFYIVPEAAATIILLSVPAVSKAFKYVKRMAVED